ncbi:MAG: hypothetical protein SFX73_36310 [Kofleriaceae bacterium]|nr:hypothetical protein [Kofleriaceae bacterium]
MSRLSLAFITTLYIVGCGPRGHTGVSKCEQDPNLPECRTVCDPAPGAPTVCPAGWHCSADGFCDSVCTPGSAECGDGYICTPDGRCIDDGNIDPGGPDAACADVVFTPKPQTPSIGLVLDQSGSMLYGLITDNTTVIDKSTCPSNPSCRYTAMRDALTGPTGVVTELQGKAYFGHNQYTCDKEFQAVNDTSVLQLFTTSRALNNASAIDTQLAMANPTNSWNTPTFAAIDAMVADFVANPPPANSPPAIILATDGLPTNCGTGVGYGAATPALREELVVSAARNAYNTSVGAYDHIPVYVLAMNIDSTHFQHVANVGQGADQYLGSTDYYTVASKAQLLAAFQTIINGVLTCDLELTQPIDMTKAEQGTVTLNGQTLSYPSDWSLVGPTTIRLEGSACDELKLTPNPTIMVKFPCGSVLL